ncbi:MAG TPA: lamin tail domain-containing protein [Anaerolineae bacterium]|nr:lamin tail domain-containing protein [Anaerolineae bacterium]
MSGRVAWLLSAFSGALGLLLLLRVVPGLATQSAQPGSVIISEVAWSGTAAGAAFEWIELHNTTDANVDLAGWSLVDDELLASLTGVIEAHDFFLLERSENALIDIEADHFLTGLLQDEGESIHLLDPGSGVVDSANGAGGSWPAGTVDEHFRSMERTHPLATDEVQYWESNDGLTRNGIDANGDPVNGTPRQANSGWSAPKLPNLVVDKTGPDQALPGQTIHYALLVTNTGQAVATGVILTDTLPETAKYVGHNSHYPLTQPSPGTLAWQIGAVAAAQTLSINVTVTLKSNSAGQIINSVEATTPLDETTLQDNISEFTTRIDPTDPSILIDALYYDGYEKWDRDEAVRLMNVGGSTQDLGGWLFSDGVSVVVFSEGIKLAPGEGIWIADQATSFRKHFGESPDYEVEGLDPDVPNLTGVWPGFSNGGDEVVLRSDAGDLIDVLVYGTGDINQQDWIGPAVYPYTVKNVFAAEGQILYRRLGENSGTRAPDTDMAQDWAQYEHDPINGRRVRYPGWDLERFYTGQWLTETAEFVIGIAPDNAFDLIQSEIAGASSEVQIASLTFRSGAIADELIAALQRGVEVTVLLEGGPVGGIDDVERHVCQQLERAGGQCWFMVNDPEIDGDSPIHDRYRYMHAKYLIIDGQRAVISTENLSPDSLPNDDKNDGTLGRRGVVVVTDAPAAVSRLRAVWQADFDPLNHRDLFRWNADDDNYGAPGPTSKPITLTGGISYHVRFTEPTVLSGTFPYGLVQSPENGLADPAGLLHLLAQAGQGDTILVEQLREKPHWGSSDSNSIDDPNPRLEALIGAARREATVRLVLDSYFDDERQPDSNHETCNLVEAIGSAGTWRVR